jgi:hypothetical protein
MRVRCPSSTYSVLGIVQLYNTFNSEICETSPDLDFILLTFREITHCNQHDICYITIILNRNASSLLTDYWTAYIFQLRNDKFLHVTINGNLPRAVQNKYLKL